MNSKDWKGVFGAAKNAGFRVSSDGSKMVDGHGSSLKPIGSNRTNLDGRTYHGASSIKKKLGNW